MVIKLETFTNLYLHQNVELLNRTRAWIQGPHCRFSESLGFGIFAG